MNRLSWRNRWRQRASSAAWTLLAALSLLAGMDDLAAQIIRPYSIRYQTNTNGDIAQIGNTVMTCVASADCTSARAGIANPTGLNNNDFTMTYVDVDGDVYGPTFNSSSADLNIPAGSTVQFAGLYWGGISASASRGQMLLKTPAAGGYAAVTASQVDGSNLVVANNYAAFADVTALVQSAGNGTYWGANLQSDNTGSTNVWGGWALIIVYQSNTKPLRNLVVFDGYSSVFGAGQTFSLSGFLTPYSGPVVTQVGSFGFDGDRAFVGDTLQVRSTTNPVFQTISDAQNPGNNFYNSSVTDGGVAIVTRNPPDTNTLGVDLDRFTLPSGIVGNGATGADVQVSTTGDQYLPVAITWATDIYVPIITPNLVKTVSDLNGGSIVPGDILRWTISMSNTGQDAGVNLVLSDPIPVPVTYVPNSLVVLSGPTGPANGNMTDAIDGDRADYRTTGGPNRVIFRLGAGSGAGVGGNDSANGGTLAYTQATSLQFDTTVNVVSAGTVISNSATIYYNGQTLSTTSFTSASSATSATVLGPPTIAKTFTPASIAPGGTSVLRISVSNPAANPADLTGVSFSDTYPAGLTNTASPAPNLTCTAGATPGVLTGGAPAPAASIGMSGATIPAGGSCDVTVNVTAALAGNYVNTTSVPAATNATGGVAVSATLPVGKLAISKSFTPSTILAGQTASLSVTIVNPLGTTVTGAAFVDNFPSNLVIAATPGPFPNPPCGVASAGAGTVASVLLDGGGGGLAANDTGISLASGTAGGNLAANGSCTFAVNVTGATAATFGLFNNTTTGVTRSDDAVAGSPSNTATLTIVGAPAVTKTIAPAFVNSGDTATVTITLTNPNTTTTLTRAGTAFTDTYPAIAGGSMINSTPANVTINCSAGSSGFVAGGTAGNATIGMRVLSLAPGGNCQVTSRVVVTGTAGTYANSTGAVTFDNAPVAAAASANVTITTAVEPTVIKSFSSTAVSAGAAVTMTIRLTNPNAAAITGVAFTDTFPSGMVNTTGSVVSNGCGGTVTQSAGVLSLAGGTINGPATTFCTIVTTVSTPIGGTYVNSTGPITTTNTPPQLLFPGTASLSAYQGLQITKAFTPNSVAVGGAVSMSITIVNPSGNPGTVTLSNIVDNFPANLQVAAPPGVIASNCGFAAGSVTNAAGALLAAGHTSVAILPAVTTQSYAIGVPCVVTINVTPTVAGNINNTVGVITSSTTINGVLPVPVVGSSNTATLSAGKVGIVKAFSPATISAGGTSTLTFTLTNGSAVAVTGINFSDVLTNLTPPLVRQISLSSATVGGTCAGVVSNAMAGGTTFTVTAGNIPASASCTITVQVTSSVTGINSNQTTGVLHATDAVRGAASNVATLTVTPPPTVVKTFTPSQIAQGGSATLSVTLTNINAFPVTNVALTDVFPSGLVVAGSPASSSSCVAPLFSSTGGAFGPGNPGFSFSGGTIATNSSCVIAMAVTAAVAGSYVNTIPAGALTSNSGANPNPASATLDVLLPLTVTKAFTPNAMAIGGSSVLSVRLTNPNAIAVTGAGFTDLYPQPIANALRNTASPAGATTCPSGSVAAAALGTSLILSGATVPASNFCDITVNVDSATVTARVLTNGAFVVATGNAGTATANIATLTVGGPSISKSFSPNPIAPGGASTLSFVITNPTALVINNVGFIDNFPAGMTLASAATAAQCGGTLYDQANATPPLAGSTGIRLGNNAGAGGGTIAANSSCTIVVAVTTPAAGVRINTTGAVTAGATVGNTASATLTTFSAPSLGKSFAPAVLGVNQASVLTVRMDNPNAFPVTGAALIDTYPANIVNASSPAGATTCAGGAVSALAGGSFASLSGATIPSSGFCLMTVNVVASTAGAYVNSLPIGALTSTNAGSNAVAATAGLRVLAPPIVLKDFIGPSYLPGLAGTTMPLNTPTQMRIRLSNPSSTNAITGAAFSDAYPSGLISSTPASPLLSGAGCAGTVTAPNGGTSLDLSGLSIPVSATCTITVNVQSAISNFYTNSTGPITTANAGTAAAASGTIYAMAPLTVAKSFTPNFIVNPPGTATSSMQVSLFNPNPYPVTGSAITDNYDSVQIVNVNPPAPTLTGTGGCAGTVTAANAASSMTLATGTVPTSGTCVINVVVQVTGANGVRTNCTDGGITTANAGAAADVCATITKGATPTTLPPVISKSFTPSSVAVNAVSTLSFTITNPNTVAINAVAFSDTFPAGLTVATPLVTSNTCGGSWGATAGFTVVNLNSGAIPLSSSCTVAVGVTGNTSGVYSNTSGTVSANTGTGNQASAVLTILDPPDITKSFTPSIINQGGVSSISFALSNNNAAALSNVAFTDTLANMTIVNPPVVSVAGAGCIFTVNAPNGGTLITVSAGTIPARVGITPGTCTITVQVTSVIAGVLPNSTSQTTSSAGTGTGSNNATLTVNPVTASVSGYVFVDTNVNGTRNPSEDWTSGVLVYVNIVSGGAVVQSAAVNAGTGFFNFPAVPFGNYTIIVTNSPVSATAVIPAGYIATAPTTAQWNLAISGGVPPVVDFGFTGPTLSQVSGRVFRDSGFAGGTSNDGILSAGEGGSAPGISGVTVTATDCAGATFATTTTDGGGSYVLRFPSSSTNVCIIETNAAGYISTGASSSSAAVTAGTCAAPPGGGSLEYDRTGDRICFLKTGGSNITYANLNFGDVPVNTWVPDQSQQTTPGNFVAYPHVFTYETGGSVTFSSSVVATNPNITGWSEVLYSDTDCNGRIDAAEPVISAAVVVTATAPPGNKVCVILKQFSPPAAPFGAQRMVRVDATFTYTNAAPALTATYSRNDTTIVEDKAASGLRLVKEVCNETTLACTDASIDPSSLAGNGNYGTSNAARSGDILRYRIIYTNTASGAVNNVVISDTTPPFTNLFAAPPICPVLPVGVTCLPAPTPAVVCAPGVSCAVRWTLTGTVASGAQGVVVFRAQVQ